MSSQSDALTDPAQPYLKAAEDWYESKRTSRGKINTNVMNSGLIVSQMLAAGLPITDERLRSEKDSQVRGLSGQAIAKILSKHGETRRFTAEGGRTSRGTMPLAVEIRDLFNSVHADNNDADSLQHISDELEFYFVSKVRKDYFDKQRLSLEIDPSKPVSVVVSDILREAADRSDHPTGAVLQHLVGAKLELRFPDEEIGRDQATAADQQTLREGDFQVGTTAFHVTVAPMEKLVDRCASNKQSGYRPVILAPASKLAAARQMIENIDKSNEISAQGAEDFIGTNIEELAVYDGDRIREGVARLIRRYNDRIDEVEVDKSLMIEEPAWMIALLKKSDNPG